MVPDDSVDETSRPPGESGAGETETADASDDSVPVGVYVRDIGSSVGAVLLVGALLFAVSGIWPPLVAIESGSMEPHIDTGDMVFLMDEERFAGPNATHGVVTARSAEGYVRFERPGDVIIFAPDGSERRTAVIHRAMFYVEDGENWYDRADPDAVGGADDCAELRNCPAPHAGFITKGDNNDAYDQATTTSGVVRAEWVVGTAELRIPGLGWIRLQTQPTPPAQSPPQNRAT
ncbi:S26 family signal peptidase [Haloarcula nitratireducens]|uniref:S26 family signal peptidase n=1 Tax=Haloarcula nitratireducens TaxID=2487749 RepID=UPI001F39FFF6|nr:S26 family signal peptidase [Halomicroarcula nitratireducens]